ncbi:MAG: CBS domain-containing protein [Planctomycetes bacterium]|nr:CBS domain-containing protein [Planctomycetota bacterium]
MDTSLWMARDLLTVTPDTPVEDGAREMARRRVRHLLVVDGGDREHLLGIVSSHDLYLAAESGMNPFSPRAQDRSGRTLGEIMTARPTTIAPTTPLAEAARLLRDKKFGCLPVVDHGRLVGVLTEHDILRAFVRWTGAEDPGYEVTAVAAKDHDAFGDLVRLAGVRGLRLVSAASFAHDGRDLLVLHVAGKHDDSFVDALWRCGHTILRVRTTGAAPAQVAVAPTHVT